jgi:hypothetical protein
MVFEAFRPVEWITTRNLSQNEFRGINRASDLPVPFLTGGNAV